MPSGSHSRSSSRGSSSYHGSSFSDDRWDRERTEYSKRWYEPIYFKRNGDTYIIPKEGSVRLRDRQFVVFFALISMIVFFILAFTNFHSNTFELIETYNYKSTLVEEAQKNENLRTKGIVTNLYKDENERCSIFYEVPTEEVDQYGKQILARNSTGYIYSKDELPAIGDEILLAKSSEKNLACTDYIPMNLPEHSYKETVTYKLAVLLRTIFLILSGLSLLLALLFMYLSVKLKNKTAKPEREYWKDLKNNTTIEKTCPKCQTKFTGFGLYCPTCAEKYDAPDVIERKITPKKEKIQGLSLLLFIIAFCVIISCAMELWGTNKEFKAIKSDRDYFLTIAKNATKNSELVVDGIVTNIRKDSGNDSDNYYITYKFTASDGAVNHGASFPVYKTKLDAPRKGSSIRIATETKNTTEHSASIPLDYQNTRNDENYQSKKNIVVLCYTLITVSVIYMVVWFIYMMHNKQTKKPATSNSSLDDPSTGFIFSAKDRLNAKKSALNKKADDNFDDFASYKNADDNSNNSASDKKSDDDDDFSVDPTYIDPDIFKF